MSAYGQFAGGPIQFNSDSGAMEARGTIDHPAPSATSSPASPTAPLPAASPTGGGVLPPDTGTALLSQPDTVPDTQPDDTTAFNSAPDTLPAGSGGGSDYGGGNRQAQIGGFTDIMGNRSFQGFDPFGGAKIGSFTPIGAGSFGSIGGEGADVANSSGFADGGEVDGPEGVEQGADNATLDPMSMFKSVLSYGRKSMGLPSNFSGGPEAEQHTSQQPSFDDGGMIPDDQGGQDAQGGGEQDDNDVTGGGNMPDPRKTLRYLTGDGAVSPEVANALERHVDPDGQMSAAQRTMATIKSAPSPAAQFGMMQHYRTMFNGFSGGAHAALDRGDLGQAAINATKAFANVPTGQDIHFAPAGAGKIAVIARDGMRKFMGAGLMGKAPVRAADDAWEKYHGNGTQQSLADGGEVEEENTQSDSGLDQGVIPDTAGAAATDADQPAEQQEQPEQSDTAPAVLSAEQFKKLITAGYDAPVDSGWQKFLGDILGSLGPSSAQAAPLDQRGGTTTVGKADREPLSPALQKQMATPTPLSQVTQSQQQETADGDAKQNSRYDAVLARTEKLANKLFPWASQEGQRSAYVAHAMDEFSKNEESKVNVQGASNKGVLQAQSQANKLQIEQMKEKGRNERATSAHTSREGIARQKSLFDNMRDDKRNMVRMVGQALIANPSLVRDPEKLANFYEQQSQRIGIHPQDLQGLLENGIVNGGGQGGASSQAPGGKPTGANMSAAQPGETRPYTKNGVTKNYKFGQDGMWHLAQ